MSGMVDWERCEVVPDVPLELETGVDSTDYVDGLRAGGPALACGWADVGERIKES